MPCMLADYAVAMPAKYRFKELARDGRVGKWEWGSGKVGVSLEVKRKEVWKEKLKSWERKDEIIEQTWVADQYFCLMWWR